ncbi:Fatty acyl-CoA synthetase A [Smittium mucronatum]|uniref:Fatty acyl-CoA synthetase A n=1 Tax=Smittium mucronatum TaxID=133383 RepID=A0A1R0GTH0_9FUNG|nr:Fatty acyl-CoA synthetase A [Smittium mucronatum]
MEESKSYCVPGSESPGFSTVRDAPNDKYLGYRPFDEASGTFGPYVFQTYSQIHKRATNLGAGIINLRLKHARDKSEENIQKILARKWPVCMYAINRLEWTLTDRALPTQSLYSVALYDTLGPQSSEYILNHSEASIVVCSFDKIHKLLLNIDNYPHVRVIISMDPLKNEQKSEESPAAFIPSPFNTRTANILLEWAQSKNIALYDIRQVEKIGFENPIPHHPPSPDDTYTMLYTSGTTGNPKGAVTTHMNYSAAATVVLTGRGKFKNKMSCVSFMPLAHTSGRNAENMITRNKGFIGYYCGDITKILEDNRALQPSMLTGVPRLLNRFYDLIASKTINDPGLLGIIARQGAKSKIENLLATGTYDHPVYDRLVFDTTKAIISKNLEYAPTGSAPIEAHVLNFLRISLKAKMIDLYGMTETSSVALGQNSTDLSVNSSGIPADGMEVRLRDVPDMEYLVTDLPCPRGEVLLRGPTIFKEYFKDEKKTRETFTPDGWLATGDIGRINSDGTVSIIDRKKSLFKLSQGEYVSPEKVEITITKNPFIMQAFVYGVSTKDYLVAIVVPDELMFIPWAQKILSKSSDGAESNGTFQQLAQNETVRSTLLASIQETCRSSGLNGFEIVKSILIEHVPFDVENNMLITPTFKLKRFDAAKYYKLAIDKLYQSQ